MPADANGSLGAAQSGRQRRADQPAAGRTPPSNEALDLVDGALRDAAHAAAPAGHEGAGRRRDRGFADIRDANNRDLSVIFPVAGVLIALILALLLRSLVAPIYLMVAVVLGFFAPLGATVFVFQGVGGHGRHHRSRCRSSCTCSWSRSAPTTTS